MLERNKNNRDAQAPAANSRAALGEIDCWIFDLDNTLYPASCRLFDQIEGRMNEFIAAEFGVDLEEAKRRRSAYFRAHGTTLSGLMKLKSCW